MSVFLLSDDISFPDPRSAEPDGLLAIGGDLSMDRLLLAYSQGIFPWYSEGSPILWWAPLPRPVIFPEKIVVSRSLRQTIGKGVFSVTMDSAFDAVIKECSAIDRRGQDGTWITGEMLDAYQRLYREGYAHSVECWCSGNLVGGLYGISLGAAFFGESMFSRTSNASKVALVTLARTLASWDFSLIDCQVETQHLRSLGAQNLKGDDFFAILRKAVERPTRRGPWSLPGDNKF